MTIDREVGGCPVMHLDVHRPADVGSYWALADELREQSPAIFDTVAQGFWVFTRHEQVREIYAQPGALLERLVHAVGPRARLPVHPHPDQPARARQVPPDPQPVVLPRRRQPDRADGPGDLPAAGRRPRPAGCLRLRRRLRAPLPDRGVPGHARPAHLRRRPVPALGRGLLRRPQRRPRHASRRWSRRSPGSASTGPTRWTSAAASPSPARATSPRTCCTPRSTTGRSPTPRCWTC